MADPERKADEKQEEHQFREDFKSELTGGTRPDNGVVGRRAIRAEELLNTPLMIAAALTLPSVVLSETHIGGWLEVVAQILNWGTYLIFALELVLMLIFVPDRKKYLKHHPVELIVVFLTPPILPASLQAFRAIRLLRLLRLLKLTQLTNRTFSNEGLGYAALMTLIIAVAGGSLFRYFEKSHQHINEGDSIYWAITTMTTLGSKWQPTTTGSEITALIILLVGVSFIALLTGSIAHRFLGITGSPPDSGDKSG